MDKKIIALIVFIVLVLVISVIVGITNKKNENENNQTIQEALATNNQTIQGEESNQTNNLDDKRILIIYFSRSGNTQTIAEYIESEVGGEMLQLETQEAYPTDYDELLDYAQKEKQDNGRPDLKTNINIDDYDVIFLGYPIWCYTVPMPIYSFLDNYDFSGKIIIPFTTHGSSGESGTFEAIRKHVSNATTLKGFNCYGNGVEQEKTNVTNWLKELGF